MLALILIPTLLFGGLEIGLRIVGFGYPTKALIEREINGKRMCCLNTQFTWRFFPYQMAREFDGSLIFEKNKSPQTYRIFVLGGSAAMGTPEPMHFFGRYLEAMLNEMYPELSFEVHNAAITAINSHVVREIARDLAEYEPDLFIVYLGNNEVVGPFGPGTVLTSTTPALGMIRANLAVKATRTGQLVDRLLGTSSERGRTLRKWSGMGMFLDKQVRGQSGLLDPVYDHFENNLRDICTAARQAGAAIVLSNVAVNLKDCPPFASLHKEDLSDAQLQQWQQIYYQGVGHEENGERGEAIECYLAAAVIDETFADLQFRLGRNYWEEGDYESARLHYQKAMEYDTLRFRADEEINQTIRDVASNRESEGVYFVDSRAEFEKISPHGVPGEELFYEHVHLNFKGNYTLARAIFPAIQKILPSAIQAKTAEVLTEEQVAQRVAFTDFERYDYQGRMLKTMLGKPPFTNQLYYDEMIRAKQAKVERLKHACDAKECLKLYDAAIREHPRDWWLLRGKSHLRSSLGLTTSLQDEEAVLRSVLELLPYHDAMYGLAVILYQQQRYYDARKELSQLLVIRPNSSESYVLLGTIANNLNSDALAIKHFRKAIDLAPAVSILPYGLLAKTYTETGKVKKAVGALEQVIAVFPEQEAAWAHFQLGVLLYYKQENRDDALVHMETALSIRPEYANDAEFTAQYNLMR